MTKTLLTYCAVMVLFFSSCASRKSSCVICGSFNLVTLTKNEINACNQTGVKTLRNLNLSGETGIDYYTIWSWNERYPDSGWTESMEKEITLRIGQLSIHPNGTWESLVKTEERFVLSPFFGKADYFVEREYNEQGTWRFVNGNHQLIELETHQSEMAEIAEIHDPINPLEAEPPIKLHQKTDALNRSRRFEVNYVQTENKIELKTIDDNNAASDVQIASTSYSLTEGNIVMTLTSLENQPKLAARWK